MSRAILAMESSESKRRAAANSNRQFVRYLMGETPIVSTKRFANCQFAPKQYQ